MLRSLALISIVASSLSLSLQHSNAAQPTAQRSFAPVTLFENGKEGYNHFRIPAIIKAGNGDLLAFCEARSGGDASEIDLVVKRSADDGKTWGPLSIICESDDYVSLYEEGRSISVGNPAPVVDRLSKEHPDRILLPFTVENDRVFLTHSDDHGKTWSKARELTDDVRKPAWGWYATGPCQSIQLQSSKYRGRIVVPCDHRIGDRGKDRGKLGAHAIISDDHGESWRIGALDETYDDGLNANETTCTELSDGSIYFNTRDQNGDAPGTRGEGFSRDGGESFAVTDSAKYKYFKPAADALDPPVVQCCVLRLPELKSYGPGGLLLFSGPDSDGPSGQGRSDMRIRYSTDESKTWQTGALIHEGPAAYSGLVPLGGDRVGLLFEAGDKSAKGYNKIMYVSFAVDDVVGEER